MYNKKLENSKERIRQILTQESLNKVDWCDNCISLEKAFIMSVFAQVAYLRIPVYELRDHTGVKVMPSLMHQRLVKGGTSVDVEVFIDKIRDRNMFFVETDDIIAVVVQLADLIVVAIRGTRKLHLSDWATNLYATMTEVSCDQQSAKLHTGFLKSVCKFAIRLEHELCNRHSEGVPVYLTGHSLGGALVATLTLSASTQFPIQSHTSLRKFNIPITAAYCYGMPRYGDTNAVRNMQNLYHVVNPKDIVPALPPKGWGFSDLTPHYPVTTIPSPCYNTNIDDETFIEILKKIPKIKNHCIEQYISCLEMRMAVHTRGQ